MPRFALLQILLLVSKLAIGEDLFGFLTDLNSRTTHSRTSNRIYRDDTPTNALSPAPSPRAYTEGVSELTIKTITPLSVSVVTPVGSAVGAIELSTRQLTETNFEFSSNEINDEQNIWDSRGRAVLVPGNLACRVVHRATVIEYQRAGLTLGITNMKVSPGVSFSLGGGGSFERLHSDYFEGSKLCQIGPIPAFTTAEKIKDLCKSCVNRIKDTLKEDVESRMSALTYLVNTNLCKSDEECYREDSYWTRGRCALVKDKNGSHFSECRARSKIGGSCPGEFSSRMFEYRCDTGLQCVKVHQGNGFWSWSLSYDYSRYECRDPKRPHLTKPD